MELIRRHGGRMLSVAQRYLSHENEAQEAVQDAFVSVFRAVGEFKGDSRLATWLHRITVNAALGILRKKRRLQRETSIEALLPKFLPDGHRDSPEGAWTQERVQQLEQVETRQIVREAIGKLPEIHRTVLMMRDIDEFSTEETGRLLGIQPNAVKARLHRARQALRTLLQTHCHGVCS